MTRKAKERKGRRSLEKVAPHLHMGESVVLVARPSRMARLPRYLISLGLYGLWRKRDTVVMTDRRMLLGRGLFNRQERSIPIRRVNDVSYMRRWISCYSNVIVDTKRGQELVRVGPLTCSRARRFTSELQERL